MGLVVVTKSKAEQDHVREQLRAAGLAQREIAEVAGIHRANVGKFLAGKTRLSDQAIEALYEAGLATRPDEATLAGSLPMEGWTGPTLSTEEAAEDKGVSQSTIRRWCKSGRLHYTMDGRKIRVCVDDAYKAIPETELAQLRKIRANHMSEIGGLREELARLAEENEALEAENADLRRDIRQLETENQELQGRVKQLEFDFEQQEEKLEKLDYQATCDKCGYAVPVSELADGRCTECQDLPHAPCIKHPGADCTAGCETACCACINTTCNGRQTCCEIRVADYMDVVDESGAAVERWKMAPEYNEAEGYWPAVNLNGKLRTVKVRLSDDLVAAIRQDFIPGRFPSKHLVIPAELAAELRGA